jgi:hypothetical protein
LDQAGAAFACRAIFAAEAVREIVGEVRSRRRVGNVGRWIDQHFCRGCGTPCSIWRFALIRERRCARRDTGMAASLALTAPAG